MARLKTEVREKRREEILEAASRVFFDKGYEGACIDHIIDKVGGSKRTIYAEFGNKEGLFAALISRNVWQTLAPLSPDELGGHDLRSTLMNFGRSLMELLLSSRGSCVYRLAVSEGRRFPDMAKTFWDNGPGLVRKSLAAALEEYRRRGDLKFQDTEAAADLFLGMIRHNQHLAIVLGLRETPDEAERERMLTMLVEVFLNGITHEAA